MNNDGYTKIVLTIAALALCALVIQQALPIAKAGFGDCGSFRSSPCYMEVVR